MLDKHTLFIADTYVNEDPSAEELADIALHGGGARCGASACRRKVAFLSHSIFGSVQRARRQACARRATCSSRGRRDIECDGEMHGDAALSAKPCASGYLPDSTLTGAANLLVCPTSTRPTSCSTC